MNAERRARWDEIKELLDRIDRRGLGDLRADEVKHLCRLYRQVTVDLSVARSRGDDPDLVEQRSVGVRSLRELLDEPREDRLLSAASVLARGGVVAYPTETFYGLAVDPLDPAAALRLLSLKGKPEGSPILLLLAGAETPRDVLLAGHWPHLPALLRRFLGDAATFPPHGLVAIVTADSGVGWKELWRSS